MDETQNNQLDPQVVALSQAIRQQESGNNPTKIGKSGEYGAYQWEPGTWEKMSQAAGVNVPLQQATPEQQNEVAYKQIAQWKQQGYNVGQIASMWNAGSGDPNAYINGNSGVNSSGVSYDTSTYAKDVANTYQQIKGGNTDLPNTGGAIQPSPSDTPNLDALLLGGGALAAGGLTLAAILQGGADVPNDVAAGAADASVAPSLWSKFTSFLGNTAKTGAEGAVIDQGLNALGGGNSSQSGVSTNDSDAQSTPTPQLPPSNESIAPESGMPTPETPAQVPASTPQELEPQLPQATQASSEASSGLNTMMQASPGNRVLAQEQDIQDGMNANGRYGIIGESDENGNYDASGTEEKANKILGDIDNGQQSVLQAEGATGNVSQGMQEAKSNNAKYVPVPEQDEANNHAQNILGAYQKQFADKDGNIPLDKWHQIAKEQGKAFDKNASNAKNAAAKSVSNAAKKIIEKNTFHKEFYRKMQKEKQDIIKGKEVNERLNGKKIPKNSNVFRDLLKQGGGALGIYLGDKIGGPMGAILGNMVGEHISRAADKRHGRNVFETKGMKAALKQLEDKNPAVHAVLQREIQKASKEKFGRDMKRESVPKLPAPKGIPLGARKGEDKSIVVGGKRPPASFAQAEARKAGRPEYGGLHNFQKQQEVLRKMVKPTRK